MLDKDVGILEVVVVIEVLLGSGVVGFFVEGFDGFGLVVVVGGFGVDFDVVVVGIGVGGGDVEGE